MSTKSLVTIGSKAAVITPTGFKNYDVCMNPYVGCEFGCAYCYVRFFVKDPKREWGEFVRIRDFIEQKLPSALLKGAVALPVGRIKTPDKDGQEKSKKIYKHLPITEARLVIGTMTDPYQPQELKHRITRKALEILLRSDLPSFKKVGIFTRSPLVLQDIELIKRLPRCRVHFTITPYPDKVTRVIEPYSPIVASRWKVIAKLKEAGIRVHVNVAPVMPTISEQFIEDFAIKLAELQVDEYFVDPMQAYKESFAAFKIACQKIPSLSWSAIESIMTNKEAYLKWKADYFATWNEARAKYEHLAPNQLPIWSDHENNVWIDMRTGQQMDHKHYNDDE
jgi:DNA repair photolyase